MLGRRRKRRRRVRDDGDGDDDDDGDAESGGGPSESILGGELGQREREWEWEWDIGAHESNECGDATEYSCVEKTKSYAHRL